jgi:tetratricopeptide (TPR) repeat protein
MKTPLVVLFCVAFLSQVVSAQMTGSPNYNAGLTTNPEVPAKATTQDLERPVFVSGKVVLPDGSPLTESAAIVSTCSDRKRIETYTDSRGNFSFELKKKTNTMGVQSADSSGDSDSAFNQTNDIFQYQNCELQAVLAGFKSERVMLGSHVTATMGSSDVGKIILHPVGGDGASVMSATSLAAPNSARKAMDKGRELATKNKIPEAMAALQKAVEIYPKYAAAWMELGSLQYSQRDRAAAQHSFEQAHAADPNYSKPYLGLIQSAMDAQNFQAAIELTHQALALNSAWPYVWLSQGTAQFNLGDLAAAENSARSGMKVDPDHRLSRLNFLLAMVMRQRNDYVQAAEYMREYLKYSALPADQAEAQKQLAEIERLSTQAQAKAAPAAAAAAK